MKKNFVNFVLAILLLISITSCANTQQTSSNMPTIRYVNFKVYDPAYVAIKLGFFEKHGVKVEIIGDVLGGPTAIQAVASGSAEAGLSSIPAIINANAAGLPVIGVSDIQSSLENQPLEYYYVLNDSKIQNITDLSDKKFAVNLWRSSFHYTALMALEQNKVDETSLEWVLLPFDRQAEALIKGDVDVIGLMEPYNSYAVATYGDKIRLLFDATDVFGEKQFTTHFVNRVWAEYNPVAAQGFVDGIVEAVAWIENNQSEAKAIVSEYTGIPAEYVPEYHFQPNAQVVMTDVTFWLDYLKRRGDITADWLRPESIATNQYNSSLNK